MKKNKINLTEEEVVADGVTADGCDGNGVT